MGTSINSNRYSSSQHTKHSMYTRNRHLQRAPMLLWTLVIFAAELKIGKSFYTTFNFFYILIYVENTIKNAIYRYVVFRVKSNGDLISIQRRKMKMRKKIEKLKPNQRISMFFC